MQLGPLTYEDMLRSIFFEVVRSISLQVKNSLVTIEFLLFFVLQLIGTYTCVDDSLQRQGRGLWNCERHHERRKLIDGCGPHWLARVC